MPFTPDEIERKEFITTLRGYDREEVRAFLEAVASDYRSLREQGSDTPTGDSAYESLGKEIATVMQVAKDMAEQARRKAEEEATLVRARAEEEASDIREAASSAAHRLREEADQYAESLRAEVDRETSEKIEQSCRRLEKLQETESKVRERLYSLEEMIHGVRRELEPHEAREAAGAAGDSQPDARSFQPPPPATRDDPSEHASEDTGATTASERALPGGEDAPSAE